MVEISAPLVATFEITNRCTCDCVYCYARRDGWHQQDVPTSRAIEVILSLLEKGVFHLSIAGGEPLLHPEFDKIIIQTFPNNSRHLILISNGLPLLQKVIRERFRIAAESIIHRGSEPMYLQISVDSANYKLNETTRIGGGRILEAIDYACDMPVSLVLASVVTTRNIMNLISTMEFFSTRVKRFHVMNLMPWIGCDAKVYEELNPSLEQMEQVEKEIIKFERRHPGVSVTHLHEENDSGLKGEQSVVRGVGCLAGTTRINIDSDLNVRPCCMVSEIMGNLYEQTFEQIWYSEWAEEIRSDPLPYCFRNLGYDLPTFMRNFAKKRTGQTSETTKSAAMDCCRTDESIQDLK
jgi:MoaA/NifB/PqqE/SkfB family radical SAM enzyme